MAPARPTVAPHAGAADFNPFHGLAVGGDGNKILVLRKTYTSASQTTLDNQAIDVYSTTTFAPGTTDFVKIGSIPLTTDASFCNANFDDCFYGNQYLLPTQDSRAVFWIGNQNLQVFNIP